MESVAWRLSAITLLGLVMTDSLCDPEILLFLWCHWTFILTTSQYIHCFIFLIMVEHAGYSGSGLLVEIRSAFLSACWLLVSTLVKDGVEASKYRALSPAKARWWEVADAVIERENQYSPNDGHDGEHGAESHLQPLDWYAKTLFFCGQTQVIPFLRCKKYLAYSFFSVTLEQK